MILTPEQKTTIDQFDDACHRAWEQSKTEDCAKYVNAILGIRTTNEGFFPYISGFAISDWYDGTTVTSFTCGKEH